MPLVAGGRALIEFEADRFYDIIDGSAPYGEYFASTHHCYGYGCCAVSFPEIWIHYRATERVASWAVSPLAADGAFELAIPERATGIEMWFSIEHYELSTWYCGCDAACAEDNARRATPRRVDHSAYDSRFGQNYRFQVLSEETSREVYRLTEEELQTNHREDAEGESWDAGVRIEIAVRDIAYDKDVRVRWTTDGWRTTHEALAVYDGQIEPAYERWTADLVEVAAVGSCSSCSAEAPILEYTLEYSVDGRRFEDRAGGSGHRVALSSSYRLEAPSGANPLEAPSAAHGN